MDACTVDVLHDTGQQDILAIADCVDFKLCSHHIFIDQDEIPFHMGKDNIHIFFYVRIGKGDNHVLTAKDITGAQQNRIAEAVRCFDRFLCSVDGISDGLLDMELF